MHSPHGRTTRCHMHEHLSDDIADVASVPRVMCRRKVARRLPRPAHTFAAQLQLAPPDPLQPRSRSIGTAEGAASTAVLSGLLQAQVHLCTLCKSDPPVLACISARTVIRPSQIGNLCSTRLEQQIDRPASAASSCICCCRPARRR